MNIANQSIETIQNQVFEWLAAELTTEIKQPIASVMCPFFQKISDLDKALVFEVLGSLGNKLIQFGDAIDLDHPDVAIEIFSQKRDEKTANKLSQILDAYKHAKSQKWNEILPSFRRMAGNLSPGFVKVSRPSKHEFVRFIKCPDTRNKIRSAKVVRNLGLNSFYKKGEIAWQAQPKDFVIFIPGNQAHKIEIEKATAKRAKYQNIGCSAMAVEIEKSISAFEKILAKSQYGLRPVSMTNAAIILAKMHGYEVQHNCNDARMLVVPKEIEKLFASDKNKKAIPAKEKAIAELERVVLELTDPFGKRPREAEQSRLSHDDRDRDCDRDRVRVRVRALQADMQLTYTPRVYPLSHFLQLMYGLEKNEKPPVKQYVIGKDSLDVLQLVHHLEHLPQLGAKPLFDHLVVLVPNACPLYWQSSNYASSRGTSYWFMDGKKRLNFENADVASTALSKKMIQDGFARPILLGDRGGLCYFISFWM